MAGLGLVVLASDKESSIVRSTISNIKYIDGDLHKDDWPLTGAVTFYESDVNIASSLFKNNNSEDMLNIVSSKFTIKDSEFNSAPSDAFDSDFSEGKIINSTFSNIKGDGVDISGTILTIKGGSIINIGDKAISVGEKSIFYGENIDIKDVGTGIVSKDMSKSSIKRSNFSNIKNTVYMSFQKKGAYGPASIEVKIAKLVSMEPYINQTWNQKLLLME